MIQQILVNDTKSIPWVEARVGLQSGWPQVAFCSANHLNIQLCRHTQAHKLHSCMAAITPQEHEPDVEARHAHAQFFESKDDQAFHGLQEMLENFANEFDDDAWQEKSAT